MVAAICAALRRGTPRLQPLARNLLLRHMPDVHAHGMWCSSGSHRMVCSRVRSDEDDLHRCWVAAACGAAAAAISAAALIPSQRTVSCASVERVPLGKVDEFTDGEMREVAVGPEGNRSAVLIHRHNGVFYATGPSCSHYKAPLRKGVSTAGMGGMAPTVSCPLHDATFDLKTGKPVRGPGLDGIPVYQTNVVDGTLLVDLPSDLVLGNKAAHVTPQMVRKDPQDSRVFALLGGGPASLAAAETLRQEGFTGRIVMIAKESSCPYDRVNLSKNLEKSAAELQLRPKEFYERWDIEVMLETVVTELDTMARKIIFQAADGTVDGVRLANDGSRIPASRFGTIHYDKVLVATGGVPRQLFCPGSSFNGVSTLRTPENAAHIMQYAKKGKRMVVVGGSFISMEVASTLRKRGCEVHVVARNTVPFERVLGKKVGASFVRLLEKEGVKWHGSSSVRLIRGTEDVNGVELEDGEVIEADGVVVGAGVIPNTRFVKGITLDKNGAVVVGPLLCSPTVPSLFAAGDVCSFPCVHTGQNVRIEHWDVATQQGRTAARNMLGQFKPFSTVPFFWSALYGKSLRFVGFAPDVLDRVITQGDVANFEFIAYYTHDDEIRAVATVNKDPVAVACSELMRRGKMPKASELVAGSVNADVILERLKHFSQ